LFISFASVGGRNIVFEIYLIQEVFACDRGFTYFGRYCFAYIWEECIQFFIFRLGVWFIVLGSVVFWIVFQCYYVINKLPSFLNIVIVLIKHRFKVVLFT